MKREINGRIKLRINPSLVYLPSLISSMPVRILLPFSIAISSRPSKEICLPKFHSSAAAYLRLSLFWNVTHRAFISLHIA